jgi:hypothetical protein
MKQPGGRLLDVPVTTQQHRWYRSKIVPAYANHAGFESLEEAHRAFKAGFFDLHPDDPDLPSMKSMSKEEATRFLDYVLRQAAEMRLVIEDPIPRGVKP